MNKTPPLLILLILTTIIAQITITSISFISPTPQGDAVQFDETALRLAQGQGFDFSFQYVRAPGYSFFLAGAYKIFGQNYTVIYWLQFLLLGLSGVIAFLIGRKMLKMNTLFSFLSALIIITWPYYILHAKLLLAETLYTFLLLLFAYCLIVFIKKPTIKNSILPGILLGLAALARPVPLLLPVWLAAAALIFYFLKNRKENKGFNILRKKIIVPVLLSFFIFAITLAPWIGYATYKTGKFVPVASTFSDVYKGANKSFINEWAYYKTPGYEPDAEVTLQKIAIIKIKNFFRFWKSGAGGYQAEALVSAYPLAKYAIMLYKIIFYLILFSALLALILFHKKIEVIMLWSIILYNWLFHAALHTQPRYNLPTMTMTIILACYAWHIITKKYKKAIAGNRPAL